MRSNCLRTAAVRVSVLGILTGSIGLLAAPAIADPPGRAQVEELRQALRQAMAELEEAGEDASRELEPMLEQLERRLERAYAQLEERVDFEEIVERARGRFADASAELEEAIALWRASQAVEAPRATERPVRPAASPTPPTRTWLGVAFESGDPVGVSVAGSPRPIGLRLSAAIADGPAARAGLRGGDVLVSIEGQWVLDAQHTTRLLSLFEPGEEVEFTVIRDGQARKGRCTLGTRPDRLAFAAPAPPRAPMPPAADRPDRAEDRATRRRTEERAEVRERSTEERARRAPDRPRRGESVDRRPIQPTITVEARDSDRGQVVEATLLDSWGTVVITRAGDDRTVRATRRDGTEVAAGNLKRVLENAPDDLRGRIARVLRAVDELRD